MNFIDRLQNAMQEKGVSAYKLCKDLGYGTSTFTAWKQNKMPSIEKLTEIVQYLGISADYLLDTEKDEIGLSKNETELLEYFRNLPEPEQLRELGRLEAKAEQYKNQQETSCTSRTG